MGRFVRPLRLLVLLLIALVLSAGLTACTPKPIILVYGDSLVVQSQESISFLFGDSYDVRIVAQGGSAICDFATRIVDDARGLRPKMSIIAFSGNSITPCMVPPAGTQRNDEWTASKYEADVTSVVSQLAALATPVVLVGGPPGLADAVEPTSSTHLGVDATETVDAETGAISPLNDPPPPEVWAVGQLPVGSVSVEAVPNAAYQRVAATFASRGARVLYVDGGMNLRSPDGGWTKVEPCYSFEANAGLCQAGLIHVRAPDLRHFCPGTFFENAIPVPTCSEWSSGSWRYALAITGAGGFLDRPTAGSLDMAVAVGPERLFVGGWAFDPDGGTSPTQVHVYVDDIATVLVADQSRPDVGAVFPWAGPAHGFSAVIDAAPGVHQVCAWALNFFGPDAGQHVRFGCRVVDVPAATPYGWLDLVQAASNSVRVAGWTIDPDAPSPLLVHVYVNGVFAGYGTADLTRTDVGNIWPSAGPNHGFDLNVGAAPGAANVCVYAINIGRGIGNPLLGCREVGVGP